MSFIEIGDYKDPEETYWDDLSEEAKQVFARYVNRANNASDIQEEVNN